MTSRPGCPASQEHCCCMERAASVTKVRGAKPGYQGCRWIKSRVSQAGGSKQENDIRTECPMSTGSKTSLVNLGNCRVKLVQALVKSRGAYCTSEINFPHLL